MRLLISISASIGLAVILLAACNSQEKATNGSTSTTTSTRNAATPPVKSPPNDGVKRITATETHEAVNKGTAVIVDVRSPDQYKQNHIKGAISMPLEQVTARIGELPRDKTIVTYCSWPAEQTSARAVQTMKANGIENAAAMLGGTNAWMSAQLPMQAGTAQ